MDLYELIKKYKWFFEGKEGDISKEFLDDIRNFLIDSVNTIEDEIEHHLGEMNVLFDNYYCYNKYEFKEKIFSNYEYISRLLMTYTDDYIISKFPITLQEVYNETIDYKKYNLPDTFDEFINNVTAIMNFIEERYK